MKGLDMSDVGNQSIKEKHSPILLHGVRSFYRVGESIVITQLPKGAARFTASRAFGQPIVARLDSVATFEDLASGTYNIEAFDHTGTLLGEELTTVGAHQGERPVHGFATSFGATDIPPVLEWHRALRSTVVQVYDWMASYTEPLGPDHGWEDPSHRPVSLDALRALAQGLRDLGAITHAYAPVYAVGNQFADDHPEMLMYEDTGAAIRFLDQIVLANPANVEWQHHFVRSYGEAAAAVGFDGFHIDTYGYPRVANTVDGSSIDLRLAYESFLRFIRSAWPTDLISFNQVNGVYSAVELTDGPGFRYCEIWPPNEGWRHFEGLLDRTSGNAGLLRPTKRRGELMRGSLACYPPVWGINDMTGPVDREARASSLRTVVMTEAIATLLGASVLIFGDKSAALCDPYYPKHARLTEGEAATVVAWRRFALRCRDLFIEGEDTSWYEIGDENGSVNVESSAPVSPEPIGGALFARVVHGEDFVSVGVVDLTGSPNGRWSEPTDQGGVTSATIRVLLDHPARWQGSIAVLGANEDRFVPVHAKEVAHRQGRALEVELPIDSGWSILRFELEGSHRAN
jgi:dextranase